MEQAAEVCFSKGMYRGLIDDFSDQRSIFVQRAFANVDGSDAAFGSAESDFDGEVKQSFVKLVYRRIAQQEFITGKLQRA